MNQTRIDSLLLKHLNDNPETPFDEKQIRSWPYRAQMTKLLQEVSATSMVTEKKLRKEIEDLGKTCTTLRDSNAGLRKAIEDGSALPIDQDDFVNRIVNAMNEVPFGKELKAKLAEIVLRQKPDAPVQSYLPKHVQDSLVRNWG